MIDHSGSGSASVLELLGARIAGVRHQDLTHHGHAVFHTALVDTVGVAYAGSAAEGSRLTRAAAGPLSPGQSLVLGTADRVSALDAGLLNGVSAHALDYDDTNAIMGGHPSAVLIPAALALAEERGSSAGQVAEAYAAGYEAVIRISRAVGTSHWDNGWHSTPTLGVLGAAATGARLLGLPPQRCATALAIATSSAAGLQANIGTMVKPLHVGRAVREGLFAARLAAQGFTANPRALEEPRGFLDLYSGPGRYELAAAVPGAGDSTLEINRCSNTVKEHECCGSTHSALEAAIALHRKRRFTPEDVERIDIVVDRRCLPHTDRPVLPEPLAGKFSLQYVVARALLEGGIGSAHFEDEAYLSSRIRQLMNRTRVSVAAASWSGDVRVPAEVTVFTVTGGALRQMAEDSPVDPTEVLHPPNLWEKFSECVGRVVGQADVSRVVSVLERFAEFADVRDATRVLEVCQPTAQGRVGSPAAGRGRS
nr:MmgE/PrpD family protein [Streptomyces noursei]